MAEDRDWDSVKFDKRGGGRGYKGDYKAGAADMRAGRSSAKAKDAYVSSGRGAKNARLDEATAAGKVERVSLTLRKAIQQGRQAKKMTQKQLATAINVKQSVVNEYESGKAVPNNAIISKMERALGCRLPRGKGGGKKKGGKGKGGGSGRAASDAAKIKARYANC